MKKNLKVMSLATLALTASLLLGACGGEKASETTESSSKASTVKKVVTSSSKKAISSQTSAASSAEDKSQETNTVGSRNGQKTPEVATPASETNGAKVAGAPAQTAPTQTPAPAKVPSLEEGKKAAQSQANQTQNPRYKGVLAFAAGDFTAANGRWEDGKGTVVAIDAGGNFAIQKGEGSAKAYQLKGYNYTLDNGVFTAQVQTSEGELETIQIITGADGAVTTVQVLP